MQMDDGQQRQCTAELVLLVGKKGVYKEIKHI